MSIRNSAVAGKFYPSHKDEIEDLIKLIYTKEKNKIKISLAEKRIFGGIVPHAGYIFSGYEAVHFFEIIKNSRQYDTIIIVNPNHTGYGEFISVDDHDAWHTPLGSSNIDLEFAAALEFPLDKAAQMFEHSAEVMLPFLQYFLDYEFKILPITIKNQNFKNSKALANKIYEIKKLQNKEILVIASSDFSHYVDAELGYSLDQIAVDEILKFNSEDLEEKVKKNKLSICGYAPIMTLLEYAKLCSDSPDIEILKRGHSGEVIESLEVVDYISMLAYE